MLRKLAQRALARLAYVAPGGKRVRPWLNRLRGVQIGQDVWISQHVYIDELHPTRSQSGTTARSG